MTDLDKVVDTMMLAETVAAKVSAALDAKASEGITVSQIKGWAHKSRFDDSWYANPADWWDQRKVFDLLSALTCPVVCVGTVNRTGWHQVCQRRAQEAMRALGMEPPPVDPVPDEDDDGWGF